MRKTIGAIALAAMTVTVSQASNYELLVRAISKMTTDIRKQNVAIAELRKDITDIQDTLGAFAEKYGQPVEGGAHIEERMRKLEQRLDANAKELEAYWRRVIAQRKAILEEVKKTEAGTARQGGGGLTISDKKDIEAIRNYLKGE